MTAIVEHAPEGSSRSRFVHALFLLFFLIAFGLGHSLLAALTVVQFVWLLITGEPNQVLRRFGASMAVWFADVVRYLAATSAEKPFPWRNWPTANLEDGSTPDYRI